MQPIQLRLGFSQPSTPVSLYLVLAGGHILVETPADREHEAWSYLSAAGANPTLGDGKGLSFPTAHLTALRELPPQVRTQPDESLAALHQLILNPSEGSKPAELSMEVDGTLWLSWYDGAQNNSEPFPTAAAVALLTAEIPFVATAEAFDALLMACALPLLIGRTRVNLDGYVEITTSKPQMVESAPLPGLFRIDETHFGMALPYVASLDGAPGFIWEGHKPLLERGPAELPRMPMPLSAHAAADLRSLVDTLAAYRAQAVVWQSGLGRRVFALAACEALDAWPLLIVCTPAAVWTWQRHVEMFGRTSALTNADADAHIITYHDLAHRRDLHNPQAVIFDDITDPTAISPQTRAAFGRLEGLLDAYRMSVSSSWPTSPEAVVDIMSVLRPGEFRPDLPVAQRYPANATTRLAEHVSAYLSERRADDPGRDTTAFRRSSVVSLSPTEAQRTAWGETLERHARTSRAACLAESLEILSAGPPLALSPKIPAAISRAQAAVDAGRRVAVLTRHRRTATLIRATLRAVDAVSVDAASGAEVGVPQTRLAIVRFDRELPDLRWFDDVIVVDYPWSTELLDHAVGPSSGEDGPLQVTILHLDGSLDDRLAMLAARRREMGPVIDHSAPPSAEEIEYLLRLR